MNKYLVQGRELEFAVRGWSRQLEAYLENYFGV